jgi:poly-gamma-glutamate capsule biosynthesis protein CapA/YwtB (metallophosphatase superfamily)
MKFIIYVSLIFFATNRLYAKDLISISAVGDIMMGTTFPSSALPENGGKDLFTPALRWLQASDIRFANFEGTFFDGPPQQDGKPPGPNRFLFRTPISWVSRLSEAGFNVVSLANNHSFDFGSAGLNSTKNILKQNGIQYASKYGDISYFSVDNTQIAMVAVDFGPGRNSLVNPQGTYAEIQRLKEKNYLGIISAHVGAEGKGAELIPQGTEIYLGENRGNSIAFAHAAIDAGADLLLMHGPHVPRGVELYKERLVAYSLGNFMTGSGVVISGISGFAPLLRVQIDHQGRFKTGQFISFLQKIRPQRIELDPQQSVYNLIKNLSTQQFPDSRLVFEDNGTFR